MRLGVCTGGGDCPGLNAAIRAVTKHAIGSFRAEVIGVRDSFNGLMDDPIRIQKLELSDVTDIANKGGTILGTFNKGNPFLNESTKEKAVKATFAGYKKAGLDCLIVIGGEGTQGMSSLLSERGMNIIGIPKTIDNDLPGTDQTIGFSSAVDIVSEAVTRVQSTAESHDRVMILEVMGRDSGYIALHGGLAGGANVILIPEIPFSYTEIMNKINDRKKLGRNFSVIVVAEGCHEVGGKPVFQLGANKKQANLGGIGAIVANKLNEISGMDTRVTVLGHVQRGGSPNSIDRILAAEMGVRAVDLASKGEFGKFVVYKDGKIGEVDYTDINPSERRLIPLDDFTLLSAERIGISFGRPLDFNPRELD
ncbi:MAG: ATP-dependent 6-phosphofructokinase [Bdellovibrionota bacterium]